MNDTIVILILSGIDGSELSELTRISMDFSHTWKNINKSLDKFKIWPNLTMDHEMIQ